jgi:hypothetical protein
MPRTPTPLPPAMKNRGIAALIWELPEPGTDWPHEAREAWFEYARKTVEVVYGPLKLGVRLRPGLTPETQEILATGERPKAAAPRYVIEPDGAASCNGRPIDPVNIPPDTVVHDYRPQPVDNEYNPIMWKSHGAQKLPLPPGVIVRAATEPWTTPSAASFDNGSRGSAEVNP